MTTPTRTTQKDGTRQLGCRANEREQILITAAADLDKRPRNSFILTAALDAARAVLKEKGVDEASLYPEQPVKATPARKRRAA